MRKGSTHSEELKKKMSEGRKGKALGPRNGRWRGGISRKETYDSYRKKNPEKVRQWKRDYHQRKKGDPNYILATNLRKRILKVLGRKGERSSYVDFLGCTVNELRFYLEGKFQDGMTWANHSQSGWHIDHEIPLAMFDLSNEAQRKSAFHYTNLQPLWAHQNLIKGRKITL